MQFRIKVGEREEKVGIVEDGSTYRVRIGDRDVVVDARRFEPGNVLSLLVDGDYREAELEPIAGGYDVHLSTRSYQVELQNELLARAGHKRRSERAVGDEVVISQMPGVVVDVKVQVGDEVTAGAAMVIVEAMKMQNEFSASRAGTVQTVHVKAGDAVISGQALVTVKAGDAS